MKLPFVKLHSFTLEVHICMCQMTANNMENKKMNRWNKSMIYTVHS